MKKILLLVTLFLTINVTAQNNWSKSDANYIIEYQNRLVNYLNKNSGEIKSYSESVLDKAYKKYVEKKLNTYIQGRVFSYDNSSHSFDKQIFSPPSQFNQNDRNFYTVHVNKLDSVLQAYAVIADKYFSYEKEKQFETDKGEKGFLYTQGLALLTNRFYELQKAIFQKSDEVEDYLFEISIEGSPKAKYLIPMNKALKTTRFLSELLYDVENYDNNKTQIASLKANLLESYQAFDLKRDYYKTQLAHEYADFERFYSRVNKYCENADEFIAKVVENPYLLEDNDFESISRHYNYIIDNYNYFIN